MSGIPSPRHRASRGPWGRWPGNPRGSQPAYWPGSRTFLGVGNDDNTTGLTHIGAREYDASTGRFITVDPIIDITDPLQMNGYTYANGNPITNLDPDGLKYFEGDSDPGFQAEASKVVQVAQKRSPKREARIAYWATKSVSKPKAKKKPSTWTNIWTGAVRGYFGMMDMTGPHGPVTAFFGVSMRDQTNRMFTQFGVESDENAVESVLAEIFVPMPPVATGSTALRAAARAAGPAVARRAETLIARVVGKSCNSFVAGTMVLLANGGSKPIERWVAGDEVRATDPETGETAAKEVTATIYTEDDKKYTDLSIRTDADVKTITTTDHHRFWSESDGVWKEAGNLKPGERLRTADGATVDLAVVRTYTAFNETYDLTVADLHTYYVLAGATPVLVHNAGGYTPPPSDKNLPGFPDANCVGKGSPKLGGGYRARWAMPDGRILEWDSAHGTIEMWTNGKKNAKHKGEFDPNSGDQLPGNKGPGRKLGGC
ncbi:polymorphic toxin-type HINT domain-containing protein [Streptomyces sp. NPDC047023]|uniref:polymorphic toxin-type HINT domain-containing protein n=1 Tax=Streptomyces sp. NPDC047023 TaxID=3155139 RepID=UPI0033F64015